MATAGAKKEKKSTLASVSKIDDFKFDRDGIRLYSTRSDDKTTCF